MKKIAILLAVLMLAVIFAGCAQESAENTELDPEIAELLEELKDDNDTAEEPSEPDLPDDTGLNDDFQMPDTDSGDEGAYSEPEPAPSSGIQLVQYDGGFFSVMIPAGWTIQPMGQYTDFSFRAWDPQNPDYKEQQKEEQSSTFLCFLQMKKLQQLFLEKQVLKATLL